MSAAARRNAGKKQTAREETPETRKAVKPTMRMNGWKVNVCRRRRSAAHRSRRRRPQNTEQRNYASQRTELRAVFVGLR